MILPQDNIAVLQCSSLHLLQYDEIYQIGWVNYYRKRQSLVVDVWIKTKTFLIFKLSTQHGDIKVIVSIAFADSYKAYIVHSWLWIRLFQCPNYVYTAFNKKNLLNSRSDSSVTFVFSCASCCCMLAWSRLHCWHDDTDSLISYPGEDLKKKKQTWTGPRRCNKDKETNPVLLLWHQP